MLSGECVISQALSCHSKNLKWRTDQCYSSVLLAGKCILEVWGQADAKEVKRRENESKRDRGRGKERERERKCEGEGGREREREGPLDFWLLFLYVFSSPLGLPYVNWASQECCLFYLESSLWPLDLLLFSFPGLFPSLSFSHHHFGLLFPILTT